MKKSKIIAPALAVLTLSTAAAVTGTVAWFTASRVKNVAMSGITAVNPESGLNVVVSNVANTTVTDPTEQKNYYTVAHKPLRDASVDIVNDKVFGSVLNDAGQVAGYKEISASINAGLGYSAGTVSETPIYYATVFNSAFSLSQSGYPYNLYFDAITSTVDTGTTTGTKDSIMKALRIGIFLSSSSYWVWAPNTDITGVGEDTVKYVDTAMTASQEHPLTEGQESYGAKAIIGKPTGAALPTEEVVSGTAATGQVGYLGALSTTAINVKIYTWFEGLDPDCVNDAADLSLTGNFKADLSFKMIRSA